MDMEPFTPGVDTNTVYIKTIRFMGTLMLGFCIGSIILKYRCEGAVEWMNACIGKWSITSKDLRYKIYLPQPDTVSSPAG